MSMFTWRLWIFSLGELKPRQPGWTGPWPSCYTGQRHCFFLCSFTKKMIQKHPKFHQNVSLFFLCELSDTRQSIWGAVHSSRRTLSKVQRQTKTACPVCSGQRSAQTQTSCSSSGSTQSHQKQQVSWTSVNYAPAGKAVRIYWVKLRDLATFEKRIWIFSIFIKSYGVFVDLRICQLGSHQISSLKVKMYHW